MKLILKTVPERDAAAFDLVYVQAKTLRAASKVLGVDHKTVGARAERVAKLLRSAGIDPAKPESMPTAEERLRAKVAANDDGCWMFTGKHRGNGYGSFWYNGKERYAHRASYEIFVGPIPKDGFIHHRCANRLCVNPEHLQCTTWEHNYAEMVARQAMLRRIKELEEEVERLVGTV
jgi:hypothetical protein